MELMESGCSETTVFKGVINEEPMPTNGKKISMNHRDVAFVFGNIWTKVRFQHRHTGSSPSVMVRGDAGYTFRSPLDPPDST
ncbi:hypothetical protein TNCV_696241 [Trichonephila clavipes]|nr:hypothetical protein TNCV_696241 [Trichonephila clavipes]